jgi:hypothetical protein
MKMPKGTIFVSVALSVCILVMGAAGAAGTLPSDGNAPAWQFGAENSQAGDAGAMRPGGQNQAPPGQRDNSTAPGSGGSDMNGSPEFFDRGNMTPIDNRTPMELGNLTQPLNGTHRMHGNMTLDNRTPMDVNATQPHDNPPAGNGTAGAGQGNGTSTGQKSPIDELIEALTRFFNKSS